LDNLELSVIIPAYLEEENLKFLLPKLKNVLDSTNINYEIIIVDSIEPLDNTGNICQDYNVKYINRESGNSYGDAVRTGINQAIGEKVLFMDADGSHSPEFILELLKHRNNSNLIIASRYIDGGGTENNKILTLMSKILNITYSVVLGIKCKDISNSFKLYDAKDLKSINLNCNNFDIVEEIIYKISKNNKNLKIKEIPYTFKNRLYGKTKRNLVFFIITYIFTIIKLKIGK